MCTKRSAYFDIEEENGRVLSLDELDEQLTDIFDKVRHAEATPIFHSTPGRVCRKPVRRKAFSFRSAHAGSTLVIVWQADAVVSVFRVMFELATFQNGLPGFAQSGGTLAEVVGFCDDALSALSFSEEIKLGEGSDIPIVRSFLGSALGPFARVTASMFWISSLFDTNVSRQMTAR